MQTKEKTDSQRLLDIERSVRRQEVAQLVQTAITIVVFLGIVNFAELIKRVKK